MFKNSALHFLVGAFLVLQKNILSLNTKTKPHSEKNEKQGKLQRPTILPVGSLAGSVFSCLEQTLLEETGVQLDEGDLGQTGASFALVDRTVRYLRADD